MMLNFLVMCLVSLVTPPPPPEVQMMVESIRSAREMGGTLVSPEV